MLCFENFDKLERKKFAENIMTTIENYQSTFNNKGSLVLSLDSAWGTGKTSLIHMWNHMLKNEDKFKTYKSIYYNAWENDDWDNPFITILSAIRHTYSNEDDELLYNNFCKKSKQFFKSLGIGILKDSIKKMVGEHAANVIADSIDDTAETETAEDYCKAYLTYLEEKNNFIEGLEYLIPNEGKLIIFIDELDRCKPDFAIKTLEVIKHFFINKDIIFVIAVDMQQLSYSISTVYGRGMDAIGYLRRFIDMSFTLPNSDIEEFVKCKFEPLLANPEYYNAMSDNINSIIYLYRQLHLSLRDIDKISDAFITFLIFYKNEAIPHSTVWELYLYFMILKYKYPHMYDLILYNQFEIEGANSKNQFPCLEKMFLVNGIVLDVLNKMKTKDMLSDINEYRGQFDLFSDGGTSKTVEQHIIYIIEMFL